jgi:hypothetical protein
LLAVSRSRLTIVALASLVALALLSLAVYRGFTAFRLEHRVVGLYGTPYPNIYHWADFAGILALPVIVAVLVVSSVFGALRGCLVRVAVLAGFAGAAFLIGEQIAKPLVGQMFRGALSFPSGNVTAVCATALAMWLALYPSLGRLTRRITFACGVVWTILMSVAVVGARWHTPLDCIGSVLLSVGVVTAGAAILGSKPARKEPEPAERARVLTG